MRPLNATLTTAFDGKPLAVIEGLPGDFAELRPHQVRALAQALARLADEAEKRKTHHRGRLLQPERRTFPVQA